MISSPQLLQATPTAPIFTTKQKNSTFQALETCSSMAELKQHHSRFIKIGLSTDNDAMGRIIKFCAISNYGDLNYAHKVFDKMRKPDAFLYNTLMRGYLQRHDGKQYHSKKEKKDSKKCVLLYLRMLEDSAMPNKFTFPSVVRACSVGKAVEEGKQIHAHVLKFGFGADGFCLNNLIHMYVNFQALEEARRIVDKMLGKDVVSWTSLITGYSRWGFIDEAYEIFESMPERNPVSWNAMIAAYVQSNRFHEAFALFDKMRAEKVELDRYAAASMLSACTGLGALEQGRWIHEYLEKKGIKLDPKLATTVIDMYCKCGCLEKAYEVFNNLPSKGISSWNCMIGGFGVHGKGKEAIKLFKKMVKERVAPDNITFVNLLCACAHSGLVDEGRHYFQQMTNVYGVERKMEHYGCIVDLLGRAGLLGEAKQVISEMPMSPDAGVLGALVGACKIHGNLILGEELGKKLIDLEPNNSGRYVMLANLYAKAGRWDDVASVRKLMNDRHVKKAPGFSVMEIEGCVSEFIAGGLTHPESLQIYAKVQEMLDSIKSAGYVPDTEGILHELDEEGKDNPLAHHSEKLAIAYGLLKTKPGETLRITKNLRVCRDCHQASKLISKVFDREIIVRDRNRFHHFRNGECSCKDFW